MKPHKKARCIKEELLMKCRELGVPLVGFAPVEMWEKPPEDLPNTFKEWIPKEFWPQSIYPEAKTVVVIGLPVQLPIVETAPSIYYHNLYNTVNALLDEKAYEISNFLTEKGYPSIYLPRDGYGDIDVLLEQPLAFFSHKHAAYLAGLGSIGLNNVILTPEYGPRVRFTSIFTTAPIEAEVPKINDLCTRCMRCAVECPVNAIYPQNHIKNDLKNGLSDPKSDLEYFPPSMDKLKCALRSKNLREELRAPCGICIKFCPIGEDRKVFGREDMKIYSKNEDFKVYHEAWEHVKRYGTNKKHE